MNKSFILLDKKNNLQKEATLVVKFSFDGKDYLVYSVDENVQNSQIFVSKLILNSEGKYFIDDIMPDEKGKLNNIVYNIVILIPTEGQKGNNFDELTANLLDKFSVKLSQGLPEMNMQEYYSNCSVAITSKVLVDAAVKYYVENLYSKDEKVISEIPTWTAPVEVIAPAPVTNIQEPVVPASSVFVQEQTVVPDLNLQVNPVLDVASTVVETPVVTSEVVVPVTNSTVSIAPDVTNNVQPNPQIEKLAIVSDPSLGLGVQQPNVVKNKKAGFANTKYIVIGTVCIVLAIAVVLTAYILIKNMG